MTIQLSNISPDFDSIRIQFETSLSGRSAWKDRLTTATGQTILEMVSAFATYSQYSIESSFQESFPDSAKNAEAIYAACMFAGVRISRKEPAAVTFNMTAPASITIPPYTQFTGGGSYWFNRDALTIGTSNTSVTLYQGQVQTKSAYGTGEDFQAFVSDESAFSVSNQDVLLKINNTNVPMLVEGLWTVPAAPGVQQLTLPNGSAIFLFGNAAYGSKPGVNDLCTFTYVVTQGLNGNNVVTTGQTISMVSNSAVSGVPTSNPSGGADEADYRIYKTVAPALFGNFDAAVTPEQYKKQPLNYPGVVDSIVLSQREINPNAKSWMNTMKVCLLTSSSWTNTQWNNFIEWYKKKTMYSSYFIRELPVAAPVNISAKVFCKNYANLTAVQSDIQSALTSLFALKQGSLGLDIYITDITDAMLESNSNIEFIQLLSPTADIILSGLSVDAPVLASVGGGTLPAGTYDYSLSVTSSLGGTSAPAKWSSIVTTSTGSVTITWPAVPNATSYSLYGRVTGGVMGLIATIPATSAASYTYIDTGSIVPSGTVPVQSTIAYYYPTLSGVSLQMAYTNRNLRS